MIMLSLKILHICCDLYRLLNIIDVIGSAILFNIPICK